MRNKKHIKAYKIENPRFIAFVLVVLILAYLVCCFLEKQDDTEQIRIVTDAILNHEDMIEPVNHPVRDAIKNFLFISISVLASSVATILIVGKNERNVIYSEAFEDVIDNSSVQIILPEKNKNSVTFTLEKVFRETTLPKELLENVIQKVVSPELPFYYENCNIDICCRVEGNTLVKTIKKDLYIKSYDEKYTFSPDNIEHKFIIARQSGFEGIHEPLKINKFYVYRNHKAENETAYCSVKSGKSDSPLYKKIGYTNTCVAYYDKELTINRKECTHVTVEHETVSPIDDLTYVFRVPCTCERLSFKYRFDSDEYRLTGHAFGFLDDAKETINSESENALSFVFENWIFKRDGICINMIKNEQIIS